ncbi:MAG: GTPase [Gloeocapsa sp. DLM2.Bin57]|nr:MAG: GTPase [Gloeocapsa sp. DLM2.Bin57]
MKIDPELLKKITTQSLANKSIGVKGLLNSIHQDPKLRNWVTMESIPLVPIPFKKHNNWHILTLLVTRQTLEDGTQIFNSPWGMIEWVVPQGIVVQIQDLRWNDSIIELQANQPKTINIEPAEPNLTLNNETKLHRENTLFELLDSFFLEPFPLDNLAPHYLGLLPREIYDYYWLLIPESKTWLTPHFSTEDETETTNQETEIITDTQPEKNAVNQESTLPLPLDLSIYLQEWIEELQQIVDTGKIPGLLNELDDYEFRLLQPGFRLAVVGEFSRGKSNLINSLLGEDVVPVGNLPTTSCLISICSDQENKIDFYLPNQTVKTKTLSEESWSELLTTDITEDNLAKIRVKINNPWLEKLDVELIDTPGANDLNTQRAAIIFDLLNQCDAVILVISATMPLSLTEVNFLEEEIIGRHVPRILVVISKLDLIESQERESVFNHITNRLAQISANIPVLPLHPLESNQSATDTIGNIKNYLKQMVDQGERKVWRSRQIASQLLDYCTQLKSLGEAVIAQDSLEEDNRQKEINEIKKSIQEAEIYWQQLEIDLEQKRMTNYRYFEQKILEFKHNLLDILKFQLKKTSNPKLWWEEDLQFILRKELVNFSRNLENTLVQKIAEDNTWLETKVTEYFATEMATVLPVSNYNCDMLLNNLEELSLTDLKKYRLLTRLGSSAAIIGGYILGGPIGVIASTGIWLYGEDLMNRTGEDQKEIIEQELESKITLSFTQYCQKISQRLTDVYRQIIQETWVTKKQWQQRKQALVEKTNSPQDIEKWTRIVKQINDVQANIINALNQ